MWVQTLGQEDPLEEGMKTHFKPTSVFLPGESHGQRSLAGYRPWSHKESDTTEVTAGFKTSWLEDRRFYGVT